MGGTVKPKLGLSAKDFSTVVFECLMGSLDCTKDDENLNSQPFNRWRDRYKYVIDRVKEAEAKTGEAKGHWLNVTAGSTEEMLRRTEFAAELGSRFIMIDYLTVGFTAFADVRKRVEELGLMLHVHRAMHAVIDRQKNHGINFNVLAKWLWMAGSDHLHTGTVVGKLEGSWSETVARAVMLREPRYKAADLGGSLIFDQDWARLKSVWPVASGGIHVHHIPDLYKIYGNDAFFLFGGETHGHPRGSRAGAEANRVATEAIAAGKDIQAQARTNKALKEALRVQWKIKRDTIKRGYTPEQVKASLKKRENDSRQFIQSQQTYADMVITFCRPSAHPEGTDSNLDVRLVLRPTLPYPDLSDVLERDAQDGQKMLTSTISRQEGRLIETLDINGQINNDQTVQLEDVIWSHLPDMQHLRPEEMGEYLNGDLTSRSNSLALTQRLITYHMLVAMKELEKEMEERKNLVVKYQLVK